MGQVTIYLDQEHEQRLKQAARAAGLRAGQRAGRAVKYALDTTALVRAATLVTHNTAEFQRIPDLQVTDWFE